MIKKKLISFNKNKDFINYISNNELIFNKNNLYKKNYNEFLDNHNLKRIKFKQKIFQDLYNKKLNYQKKLLNIPNFSKNKKNKIKKEIKSDNF
jgi:hypothetical protein